MKKDMQKLLIFGGIVTFAIGIIFVILSPTMGISLANGQIPLDGMDTNYYNGLMSGYINAIRMVGGIVAALGGLETICAFYFYPKRKEYADE